MSKRPVKTEFKKAVDFTDAQKGQIKREAQKECKGKLWLRLGR